MPGSERGDFFRRNLFNPTSMSFVYEMNRIGPRTGPCETPMVTGFKFEAQPFTTTRWSLLSNQGGREKKRETYIGCHHGGERERGDGITIATKHVVVPAVVTTTQVSSLCDSLHSHIKYGSDFPFSDTWSPFFCQPFFFFYPCIYPFGK